ncbi:MAG TPA: alpha-1,2-fucosyltransferase [Sideroxyarcus sp.]|nr:alpha-1,2-fucosyltransferase [Sideroxyarcus sp.]
MIISHIIGGLGNQMFQYAAARALSLRRGQPLYLDVSEFAGYDLHHGFELDRVFNCPAAIATRAEMAGVLGWQSFRRVRRAMARPSMARWRRDELIVEPCFQYWEGIDRAPQDCYLMGYWQSDRYFQDCADTIRAEFAFQSPLAGRNAQLARQMDDVNAVSLHVRRGDYANNPKAASTHGLCPPDYYREAVQLMAARIARPHLFIFSDDMVWVKENLKFELPCEFVEHNRGTESYNDMRLMSLCKHHIIANSSFSWWGAWLNPDPGKIVVAPQRWFAKQIDTRDLLPKDWVRL